MFIFGVASLSLFAVSGEIVNSKQYLEITPCDKYYKFSTWDTHEEHARCQKKMGDGCEGFKDCGAKDEDYETLKAKCTSYDKENPLDWCVWLGDSIWEKQLYPCYGRGPSQYCVRSPPGKCRMVVTCPNGDQYNTCFGTMCHEEPVVENPQTEESVADKKKDPKEDGCAALSHNKKLCNKDPNCVYGNRECISFEPSKKACKKFKKQETMCVLMGCRYEVAKGGKKKKCVAP